MKVWLPTIRTNSGADIYVDRLDRALRLRGIEVVVTYFPRYYEFYPYLFSRTKPPEGTDIIHANSWYAFAFKNNAIPIVATVHSPIMDPRVYEYKSILQKIYHKLLISKYEKYSFSNSRRIVSVSHYVKNSLSNNYGVSNSDVIYNFINTELFTPISQPKRNISQPFRLLFIGNFTRLKGRDMLIEIMKKLGNDFELSVTAGLRDQSFKIDQPNIKIIGKINGQQLISEYRKANALVFPTKFEGFGYAALESMACGIPVIASDNTSLPEIIEHHKSGILCPTDDIDAFVSACRYLRDNPEIRKKYGKAARTRAVIKFSQKENVTKYIDLYSDVIDK